MSAWSRLLASSSLAIGTAWDLITHPKTGGGGSGVVVNTGIAVSIADSAMTVSLADAPTAVVVPSGFAVLITDTKINVVQPMALVSANSPIEIRIKP